ncbi:MAG: YbaB/EbfC family nucleoid-associated protein [Candidatus Margulisbacteria bacterium]|nr:YbaB/EbfC family nucleoid-associated protein [Candidatus Margulisiibacteriota bacterium]
MIFGNLGNMGEMIKMAREMQGQLKKIKEELKNENFEIAQNGIKVVVNGDMEIKELAIDPKIVDQNNVARLEKSVKDAVSRAMKDAKDGAARKMKGLTGGLGLPPGLF